MKERKHIIGGMLLLAIGIGWLGNLLSWWKVALFFDGWWLLLLLLPCITHMYRTGISFFPLYVCAVVLFYLLGLHQIIDAALSFGACVALGCICMGITMLFRRSVKWNEFRCKD